MPKPLSIIVEVEPAAVGPVMLMLNSTPGVGNVHLDLDQTKKRGRLGRSVASPEVQARAAATRRQSRETGITGRDQLVSDMYAKNGPVDRNEMRRAFEANGRSPKSVDSIFHTLKTAGLARTVGDGGFELTAKGRKDHEKTIKAKKG